MLQQLYWYSSHLPEALPHPMYERRAVRWLIDLDDSGTLLGLSETGVSAAPFEEAAEDNKQKISYPRYEVPYLERTSGKAARLLADNIEYVLGLAGGGKRTADKNIAERHRLFVELTRIARVAAGERGDHAGEEQIHAIERFLANWDAGRIDASTLQPEITSVEKAHVMTFRVNGRITASEMVSLRDWWIDYTQGLVRDDNSYHDDRPQGRCLLSGGYGSLARVLPRSVNGLSFLEAASSMGTQLTSVNEDTGESRGRGAAYRSPVGPVPAERAIQTLNSLLAQERSCVRVGDRRAYVFWPAPAPDGGPSVSEDALEVIPRSLGAPEPALVQKLLRAASRGEHPPSIEAGRFFGAVLSANRARAVVRDFFEVALEEAQANLGRWFSGLEIDDRHGYEQDPAPTREISAAVAHRAGSASKEEAKRLDEQLLRVALLGEQPPRGLLETVLKRVMTPDTAQGASRRQHLRIGLLKLLLCKEIARRFVAGASGSLASAANASRYGYGGSTPGKGMRSNIEEAELKLMEELKRVNPDLDLGTEGGSVPYHCGRLLAEIQQAQLACKGKSPGTTVADRYLRAAAVTPARILRVLIPQAQAYHARLRKENEAAYKAVSRRFQAVVSYLPEKLPASLDLVGQGQFVIGFHHQLAANAEAARRAKEAKDRKKEALSWEEEELAAEAEALEREPEEE